jgi:hypothetical protein
MAVYNIYYIKKQNSTETIDIIMTHLIKSCYMKKVLLMMLLLLTAGFVYSQTTYYWVGSSPSAANTNISTNANWNTALNGAGSARTSSTGATDILVFDGTNLGGTTTVTGPVTVNANASITCAQLKFINNATVNMVRPTSGTSTITLNGEVGEDFVVDAGANFNVPITTAGSLRFAMTATSTGRVSGALSMITGQQCRIDNTTAGIPGSFIFTSGSSLTTNITSASSSYAFGSSAQSSEKWVVFESGSHVYYDGGFSPMGSGNLFSAIDMRPGSTWHQRATNPTSGFGNFFNRKGFGNIVVENNANLIAEGPIYRIENLTINTGSTFTTHSSGQTVVLGNIIVNGNLLSDAASTNELLLAGNTAQSITGSGTISIAGLIVADNANISLGKDISVNKTVNIFGKINFNTYKLSGTATFNANGQTPAASATGNLTAGSFMITGNAGVQASMRGLTITGAGIAPNTSIVSFSGTSDSIFISNPLLAGGSGVALSLASNGAVLQTANLNGFDPVSGSASLAGAQTFNDGINYIINGATTWPFGVSTSSSATPISAKFIETNAPVTVNRGITVSDHLTINGKLTLRPLDIVHIVPGAVINGTINSSNYIATASNSTTGDLSILQYDGIASPVTLPIGTTNYYLPVTINPSAASNFTATVFEGITSNGVITGTPLTPVQKQTVVNAVWNINRTSGTGSSSLQLGWNTALEGSTFATLPSTDIGVIANTGSSWSLPVGTGDNTANTVTATVSSFGSFSAGAVPPTIPFIFNVLPAKTYGDADFNGGAVSLNTTQPVLYSSSNPAVATIVGGNIHITGAGTADITASQASDGFYPAASITRTLTVGKAALTITADNKLKFQGQVNPTLTVTYTGFVLGETSTSLLTQPTVTTTAITTSPAGSYPITVSGATAANYTISFVNGTLTVQPQLNQTITFNAPPTKTYGNADFASGVTSTNTTIPVTLASSNTAVATIIGTNIHIVGGGTATITASQAGNAGYFPAADVARTLTVNKAALTIKVRDTTKVQGEVNPVFTITYTGFVLGETVANLSTPPTVNTIATTLSPAGYYTLSPEGAVSNNYTITTTAGRLTIYPPGGTAQNHLHAFMSNSTTLTVRVFSTYPALSDIRLYDLSGKPLLKKNVFLPQGFIESNINVSTIPSGIYVVTVTGSGVDLKKTIPIIR